MQKNCNCGSQKSIIIAIALNYLYSDYDSDVVIFTVPSGITPELIAEKIKTIRDSLPSYDYVSAQDKTDSALNAVADEFGGSWEYLFISEAVDIED